MKRLPYICTLVVRGVLRGRGVWPLHSSQFSFYLKYIFKFFVKLLKSNPCKLCQIRNITYATAGGCGVKMVRGYDVPFIDLGGKPLDSVSWKERFLSRERERENALPRSANTEEASVFMLSKLSLHIYKYYIYTVYAFKADEPVLLI